ncbi:MAG: glycosyl hydrolase family 18 protein [Clostridium sp.]|uniref:glycosyl hydrolase family 18 protein n=1 Tax=Clostridium TaxID=1485 RepID=UPI00189B0459|nr:MULTISPECIES: glycosyl hydrolase family 18 protein [Clostridium]MDU5210258.1 glycosyl hydrolase family 18 protein [Clostridium sp.]MDU6761813.1 glycosyl hydrolase family 18 protein [Clostridium sp.]
MKKRLSLLLSLFLVVGSVGLTSGTVTTSAKENTDQAVVASTTSAATNKRVITYFPSWGMYEAGQQNITVDDIPWDKVSQVNHAFFEITNDFKIQTTDSYADFECADFKHSPEWGEGLAGHFGEYQYYKSKYPDVKIVIAVGGWTRSDKFHAAASTEQNRKTLAQSMVDTMKKYPFIDGIDIDWEYPTETRAPEDQYDRGSVGGPEDKHNFTLLLKTIRETFDQNGMKDKLLTVAVSAGESKIHNTEPDQYAQYVDAIGVMTYDFAGDWDDVTGHLAGLYHNPEDTTRPKFDTDDAMKIYSEEYNVPKSKLYAGSPLYSRGWGNVAPGPNGDGLFQPGNKNFTGNLGTGGQYSWYDIKNIEKTAGWVKYRDPIAKVPYLYNSSTKQFLTYEDETSLQDRINYINDNGYGGLIVWDCSGDDVKGGWPMHTIMFNGLIKDGSETPPTQNTLKAASLTAGPVSNGKYTLTAIVPAYNTATSYQILEGNTVISSGTLNSGSQTPITINYDITGKESGTYNYTVVLSDGSSKVTSTEVKVTVSAPVENTLQAASLTAGQVSGGSFTLNIQIPANNTATSYQILEGNTVISTGSLTVGSALRNISYNVTGKGEGNYNYTVVLSDGSKTVTSNIVSVSVQKPSSYPAWEAWVSYKTGDIVSYNGKNYTCRQGHTSLVVWEPSNVQALWSLI